jgi:hypothetical protein
MKKVKTGKQKDTKLSKIKSKMKKCMMSMTLILALV